MTDRTPPRVEDAPGLVWRERKKTWVAYWQARSDLVKRGYAPGAKKLWEGVDLGANGARKIASQCRKHQASNGERRWHTQLSSMATTLSSS